MKKMIITIVVLALLLSFALVAYDATSARK